MKKIILQLLDKPSSVFDKFITVFLLSLVYISIFLLVIEVRYPDLASTYQTIFFLVEYIILGIFTIEIIFRIICDPNRHQYFKSFYGIVDLIAVIPGLLAIFFPALDHTAWVRIFRIIRFVRILKLLSYGETMGGITQALMPYFCFALGFKGIMVAVEGQPWWPEIGNLNVVLGVVGFSLAILLGTKLQVINSRLYSIEDAVCRIVGSMRDMQENVQIIPHIKHWAKELESALTFNGDEKAEVVRKMRLNTDQLEQKLEEEGIGGPNTAGFHRDVAYLLHRSLARTPQAYENFLKTVICTYTSVVIATVPGLTGFFATFLLVYVLGGLFLLIDDMDKPLDFGKNSLISVRLDPLIQFNDKLKK
ncbi:MAG: hypothetical protein CL402_00055 [Acidiferrobacteraceae bacterium]|nr:hypothetical protein [Acidiferrobacteraceae bacterium]